MLKKFLFKMDEESKNHMILNKLKKILGTPFGFLVKQSVPLKTVKCMGLSFKNPVGLSPGMDYNAEYIDLFGSLGFGFIEVGTVTPKPKIGNLKPRIFAIKKAKSLISRIGYENKGIDFVIENIKKSSFNGIIGINIASNENQDIESIIKDHLLCIEKSYPIVGYISINIPSVFLSNLESLKNWIKEIKNKQKFLKKEKKKYVPIVIKIQPDLTKNTIIKIAENILDFKVDGIIATNSTKDKNLINGLNFSHQKGTISGKALQIKSTNVIKILKEVLKEEVIIIGSGGVDSLISAREKIFFGASLVQVCTGFIYKGPKIIKEIVKYI
ncbi:dihydroorotate dehydrogenase (quinone) [bacterium endosymbiont of Pedicinus badii]|uniref:dihydroorotate dehydrogenase (quinone) n=1 Tax=bacterium endosymbiont of Pedicinus badii TaxID=1719126 RepID=UPI0024782560|nr:dihydroorotate dehydrogenase (quinone) [bacterium endosymbiont of Pedicinus badii]